MTVRLPTRLLPILLLLLCGRPAPAQLTPVQAAQPTLQTRPRYTLRAGDTITTDYRLTPEFNQTVLIQPDGFLDLSLIGPMHVAGLTVDQLHEQILARVASRLKNAELNVSLKEFEKLYVVVAGEVDRPGKIDFYEKTTALQAVLLAGGFKASAQQSDVYLFRRVDGDLAEVHHLDLKKVQRSRDLERDLLLQPGDMILVPRNKLENVSRFIKATNLSIYFDPLQYAIP